MRTHLVAALALGTALLASPAFAAETAQQDNMKTCAATWKTMSAADKSKTKYTAYMGTCMKAPSAAQPKMAAPAMAPAPAAMKMAAPAGGSAKCKDGKTVTYKVRSGTCSGHGGVATWM